MDFSTDLFKLLPKRFREGDGSAVWEALFSAFGSMLNTVHSDIEGLADIDDKDRVPAEYMNYLADLFGFQLVVTAGASTEERRRIFLKDITRIINHKGTEQLIQDLAHFLYFVAYPGVVMWLFDLWTADYVNFSIDPLDISEVPVGWTGDGATVSFSAVLLSAPARIRSPSSRRGLDCNQHSLCRCGRCGRMEPDLSGYRPACGRYPSFRIRRARSRLGGRRTV